MRCGGSPLNAGPGPGRAEFPESDGSCEKREGCPMKARAGLMGSSGGTDKAASPRKPSLPLSSRSMLPIGVMARPRSRIRASIIASMRAMRASMLMPRVLASLALRSVPLSDGMRVLRGMLLPFPLVLEACD